MQNVVAELKPVQHSIKNVITLNKIGYAAAEEEQTAWRYSTSETFLVDIWTTTEMWWSRGATAIQQSVVVDMRHSTYHRSNYSRAATIRQHLTNRANCVWWNAWPRQRYCYQELHLNSLWRYGDDFSSVGPNTWTLNRLKQCEFLLIIISVDLHDYSELAQNTAL